MSNDLFTYDIHSIRLSRQETTNNNLAETLCYTEFNEKDLVKLVNFKSLDRLCKLLKFTRSELYDHCRDNFVFALTVAHGCAILSSRQGSRDETFVINQIDKCTSKIGINIQSINNQEMRPTKDGRILTRKEFKKSGLTKLDCLKSFDAVISGNIEGYVFAKIVIGEGGHQDNVFHEASQFGDWVKEYGDKDKVYVVLVDTDLNVKYNDLRSKYDNDNLWIVDHVEFQTRLNQYANK